MKKIIVVATPDKETFQAMHDPGFWSIGATPDAAVGNLIRTFPDSFGIEIDIDQSAIKLVQTMREQKLKEELDKILEAQAIRHGNI